MNRPIAMRPRKRLPYANLDLIRRVIHPGGTGVFNPERDENARMHHCGE